MLCNELMTCFHVRLDNKSFQLTLSDFLASNHRLKDCEKAFISRVNQSCQTLCVQIERRILAEESSPPGL